MVFYTRYLVFIIVISVFMYVNHLYKILCIYFLNVSFMYVKLGIKEGSIMRISEYLHIGDKLKKARKLSTFSQRDMAKQLGLSFSTYSNYENGYSEPPVEVLENFCATVNISMNDLLELQVENVVDTHLKTFSELLAILIDLDRRGLPIEGKTTYSPSGNQLTAHLTLDIANAQLATFIPDWNNVNQKLADGLMDQDEYDLWLKDTLALFNVPIDEFLYEK